MVAPVILAAAPSIAASTTKDGGIINTLLKAALIVAIFGILILGFMWVTGEFSLENITQQFADWYIKNLKKNILRYTPLGWAVSGISGAASLFTGKIPKIKTFFWRSLPKI